MVRVLTAVSQSVGFCCYCAATGPRLAPSPQCPQTRCSALVAKSIARGWAPGRGSLCVCRRDESMDDLLVKGRLTRLRRPIRPHALVTAQRSDFFLGSASAPGVARPRLGPLVGGAVALQLVREDAFKSLCCSSAPCPRVDALVAADAWGPHLLEPP